MIWTVSTIKDTIDNLERFVTGNLAGGADHLVVFVDDDEPRLLDFLGAHPHTTGIAATSWWGKDRPGALNSRQRVAANAVRAIAVDLGDVDWIFHIDGDEVVQLDPQRLEALPDDVTVARLEPLESVAAWEPDPRAATLFKRRLTKDELNMLVDRGVIDRPRNDHYFHGHVSGKVGMRPRLDAWLGIHRAMDSRRQSIAAHGAPWLRMLHYESPAGADFVRKWRNLLTSGTRAAVRTPRAVAAESLRAAFDADPSASPESLRKVFEATTADDVDTLLDLELLVMVNPLALGHVPRRYVAEEELSRRLAALTSEDKRVFEPEREEAAVRALLERIV